MAEELGKIEKPPVEDFQGGRKLFFVPLIFSNPDLPQEFGEKYTRYWDQVESQIGNLELKLGPVNRIYHELIPHSGDEAVNNLKQLKVSSLQIIQKRMSQGATFESLEDQAILEELMDWRGIDGLEPLSFHRSAKPESFFYHPWLLYRS